MISLTVQFDIVLGFGTVRSNPHPRVSNYNVINKLNYDHKWKVNLLEYFPSKFSKKPQKQKASVKPPSSICDFFKIEAINRSEIRAGIESPILESA